jgi:hypothetical protein
MGESTQIRNSKDRFFNALRLATRLPHVTAKLPRRSDMYLMLLLLALVPFRLMAVDPAEPMPTPLMRVVEPGTARVGDEVLVTGDNLGKQYVAEIFLTAGQESHKVQVLSQEDKAVKFKVPTGVKAGPYRITVLIKRGDPILIEEPVRLLIEE